MTLAMAFAMASHGQYSHGRHHGDDESVKHTRASVGFINDVTKLFQNKGCLQILNSPKEKIGQFRSEGH